MVGCFCVQIATVTWCHVTTLDSVSAGHRYATAFTTATTAKMRSAAVSIHVVTEIK